MAMASNTQAAILDRLLEPEMPQEFYPVVDG